MNFALSKQNALTKKDKSHEQSWDDKIKPLCDKISSHQNLYTTSSCSGRITIIPETNQKLRQGFLFKTHEAVKAEQIFPIIHSQSSTIWFRMEPAALHIACKELPQAQLLLTKARNLGWKKSGIISIKGRYIIELFAPEILIAPITKSLPEEYLKLLIKEANKKLEQTWAKIEKLKALF